MTITIPTKRVLMTGSRTWIDRETIHDALLESLEYFGLSDSPQNAILINGTAKGADSLAAQEAKKIGMTVEDYPAQWSIHSDNCPTVNPGNNTCWTGRERCKRAGFRRNLQMIETGCDLLLAFIHNNSNGASMTVDLAKARNIEIWRYDLIDDPKLMDSEEPEA